MGESSKIWRSCRVKIPEVRCCHRSPRDNSVWDVRECAVWTQLAGCKVQVTTFLMYWSSKATFICLMHPFCGPRKHVSTYNIKREELACILSMCLCSEPTASRAAAAILLNFWPHAAVVVCRPAKDAGNKLLFSFNNLITAYLHIHKSF
jgi:hypothetical protein